MRIEIIYGAVFGWDCGLLQAVNYTSETLRELGVSVGTVDLASLSIPFFDGRKELSSELVFKKIASASAVILAFPCFFDAPCAIFSSFLEHLLHEDFSSAFQDKAFYILTTSNSEKVSDRRAADYVSEIVYRHGGYDALRLSLSQRANDEGVKNIIEKNAEDFFRIIRQNRRFLKPTQLGEAKTSDFSPVFEQKQQEKLPQQKPQTEQKLQAPNQPLTIWDQLSEAGRNALSENDRAGWAMEEIQQEKIQPAKQEGVIWQKTESIIEKKEEIPFRKTTLNDLLSKYSVNNMNSEENKKLEEISRLFSQKMSEKTGEPAPVSSFGDYLTATPEPREKTIKQMTQNLPHYFQPQISKDLSAVFQFNITGKEQFSCRIIVNGSDCYFEEGEIEKPDIQVFADSKVWSEVLKGKHTAQKAFMIGLIKVRGNFVLLTKFDQLFNLK